jgi:hypothetical protein
VASKSILDASGHDWRDETYFLLCWGAWKLVG